MCQDKQQTRSNPSGNLCQHGAYADLCITCHPVACETVKAAIAYSNARKESLDSFADRLVGNLR